MKTITLTCIGIFIALICYSQSAIKKTNSSPGKPSGSIIAENTIVIKEKPQRILTPEEIRKKNVMDLLSIMLEFNGMISSDYHVPYDLMLNKSSNLEYKPETDTSAEVLFKNSMNHTLNRISVSFDSLKVKRMVQFALIKENSSDNDNDAKWNNELANSFVFKYDSARLTTILKAHNGWEDVAWQVDKYFISYKNNLPDSITWKDSALRTRAIAYFNEKQIADSVYLYSYELPEGRVFFLNKSVYKSKGDFEIQKEVIEKYAGINRKKALCDSSHLILYEKRIENPLHHQIEVSMDQYKYDTNGLLSYSVQCKVDTKNANEPTDTLKVKGYPYRSTYLYNENNQVVKQIIAFSDGCIDSEEIITYSIGAWGFVIQTSFKKVVKNKCIY